MQNMITKNTRITLGAVASIVVLGAGVLWQGFRMLTNQEVTNANVAAELKDIKEKTWTIASASEHALRTAMENPGLRVPDPRDPSKVFEVHAVTKSTP